MISAAAPNVNAYFNAAGDALLGRTTRPHGESAAARSQRAWTRGGGGRNQAAGAPPAAAAAAGRAAGAPPPAAPPAPAPAAPAAPPKPVVRKDACAGKPADPEWRKAEDARLAAAAAAAAANPDAAAGGGRGNRGGGAGGAGGGFNRAAYLKAEGVLGTFSTAASWPRRLHDWRRRRGTAIRRRCCRRSRSPRKSTAASIAWSRKGVPVIVEADIKSTYTPMPPMFNVVGEIRGTDKADEVVMLGAHFDSWHASTGATDNAAGSAAMLEAMRILKVSGVKLRRTVRIGLWTGEEQGLIGSRALRATALRRRTRRARRRRADATDRRSTRSSPATSTSITARARFAACICRAFPRWGRSSARGWSRSRASA